MINKNLSRWIWASVSKYFNDNKGNLVFFFEGDDRATDETQSFCEFRMDGPRIKEISKNYFDINVYVNVLIQRHMDQVGTHEFWQMLGQVQNLFPKCLNVFKYGDGPEDDATVMIGTLELQYSSPLDQVKTANFGQVDHVVRLQQATVEGRYRLQLTSNIDTIFYLSGKNDFNIIDSVIGDTSILLSNNLALTDVALANLIQSLSVSDALAFVDVASAIVEPSVFRVFYTHQNPSNSRYEIRKIQSDGTGDALILDTGLTVLQTMAYDRTNDFIFYGRNDGTVRKVKPDGTGDVAVVSGFGVIIALTLDPVNNRMWLYDRTTNFIQQMTLTGTGLTNLTAESYAQVRAVAYDAAATSLFWCNTTQARRYNFSSPPATTLFNPGSTDIFSTATDGGGTLIWFTRGNFIVRNNYAGSSETSFNVAAASGPFFLFHHPIGNFFIYTVSVDATTASIRKINGDGTNIQTIATKTGLDNGNISAVCAG